MSNQTTSISDYVAYLNQEDNAFLYFALWIIWPVGVVGNLISFYIYTRPNLNKKTNSGFLYAWLCLVNLVALIYYIISYRSANVFGYTLYITCGVDNYVRRTFLNSISWMQAIVCFDRFIFVYFPSKTHFFIKKSVQYSIILGVLALILITNMTNLLTYQVPSGVPNQTICYMSVSVSVATNMIAVLMRVFVPFGIMITLNILVIIRLKQSKIKVGVSNLARVADQGLQGKQITNKQYRFFVATLIIDFIFLIFYTPLCAAYAILIYDLFYTSITGNLLSSTIYLFFSNVSQTLAIAHTEAILFVFVIFNQYFRDELINLLGLRRFFPQQTDTNVSRTV